MPAGEAREPLPIVSFDPKEFPFERIVPDDGRGKGGGWQEAKANLSFWQVAYPHLPRRWQCPLTIGMPLRTELAGRISPKRAAEVSVEVTGEVARWMDYNLPSGIFCHRFVENLEQQFKLKHPKLGAKVKRR